MAPFLSLPCGTELREYFFSMSETAEKITSDNRDLSTLIKEAKAGSGKAFEELCIVCLPNISREVKKYVFNSDIEDVVQESVIKLFYSLKGYSEEGQFFAWLRKLVARTCIDFWRQTQRQRKLKENFGRAETDSGHVEQSGDFFLRQRLQNCLDEMGAEDRIICTMVFLEQRSHKEVADIIGFTVMNVKVRCFRLKKRLQKSFTL